MHSRMDGGDEQVWKYIMSPREPSVNAGQNIGMSFYSYE
jgi:hypothetical protein